MSTQDQEPTYEHADEPMDELINEYIEQLNEQEQLILNIAINHLKSSFDIKKSIGFMEWKNKKGEK